MSGNQDPNWELQPKIVLRKWQTSWTWGTSPALTRPSWRRWRCRRMSCWPKRPLSSRSRVKFPKNLEKSPPPISFGTPVVMWRKSYSWDGQEGQTALWTWALRALAFGLWVSERTPHHLKGQILQCALGYCRKLSVWLIKIKHPSWQKKRLWFSYYLRQSHDVLKSFGNIWVYGIFPRMQICLC